MSGLRAAPGAYGTGELSGMGRTGMGMATMVPFLSDTRKAAGDNLALGRKPVLRMSRQ